MKNSWANCTETKLEASNFARNKKEKSRRRKQKPLRSRCSRGVLANCRECIALWAMFYEPVCMCDSVLRICVVCGLFCGLFIGSVSFGCGYAHVLEHTTRFWGTIISLSWSLAHVHRCKVCLFSARHEAEWGYIQQDGWQYATHIHGCEK